MRAVENFSSIDMHVRIVSRHQGIYSILRMMYKGHEYMEGWPQKGMGSFSEILCFEIRDCMFKRC